ncbi:Probable fructokinase-6, chloroplastic [Linum grandiflorum]
MALLHSPALCFGGVGLNSRHSSVSFRPGHLKPSSFFSSRRLSSRGKAASAASADDDSSSSSSSSSSLVVCFGEMLIDFVPTINGLSLADAPAFKKAPGGAPANVAVGISRLGGSSAFIGKVRKWLV